MKHKTIYKTIKDWAEYMQVECPQITLKIHVKQKRKTEYGCNCFPNDTLRGTFNPNNKKITIYRGGDNLTTLKHLFIHYLRHLKHRMGIDKTDWNEFGKISYEKFMETIGLDGMYDEKVRTRQLTCAGWMTIFMWFNGYDKSLD